MAGPTDPPDWVKDNKGNAKDAFDRALVAKQEAAEQVDSQQVKNSAPKLAPSPSGLMRVGPDASAHVERMAKDNSAVKEARDRADSIKKDRESQNGKGKDEPER